MIVGDAPPHGPDSTPYKSQSLAKDVAVITSQAGVSLGRLALVEIKGRSNA